MSIRNYIPNLALLALWPLSLMGCRDSAPPHPEPAASPGNRKLERLVENESRSFVHKSHLSWDGANDEDVIAIDIGNNGSDRVYTWRITGRDNNHGTVCIGTSDHLCSSQSEFYTPVSKYWIQGIAIAKNTQQVYTWYTNPTRNGVGQYVTTRLIGTSTKLNQYDSGTASFTGFEPASVMDVGISNNGQVYYYHTYFDGLLYRSVGSSTDPCAGGICGQIINPTRIRDGVGDIIVGIAFNSAGTMYTWYPKNQYYSNTDDLNTSNDSRILW